MNVRNLLKRLRATLPILIVISIGLFIYFRPVIWRRGGDVLSLIFSPAALGKNAVSIQKSAEIPTMPKNALFPIDKVDIKKSAEIQSALSTRIDFYGVVLDQDNNPVRGADILYSLNDEFTLNDPKQFKADPSGEDGRFFIQGKHGLGIFVSVSHEGYYNTETSQTSVSFYRHANSVKRNALPNSEHPMIFRLIKRGEAESLMRSQSGSIIIPVDGTPTGLRIRDGDVQFNARADILIECTASVSSNLNVSNKAFSWKCKISIPGGGLIVRNDQWLFIAPESGYMQSDIIDMRDVNNPDWQSRISREYFIRLKDGKFARCNIQVIPNGSHYVVIDAYYNPSGSRNLEYDPSQQIKRQKESGL